MAPPALEKTKLYRSADDSTKASLDSFTKNGYAIVRNYVTEEEVDYINNDVNQRLENGSIHFKNGNKLMFLIHQSDKIKELGIRPEIIELTSCLMHGQSALFQSINIIKGSEQHAHYDSIHMNTFSEGGLIGMWIALENINVSNGPLFYYRGSHKLPYYMNSDYDNEGNFFRLGKKDYHAYEDFIEKKILEKKLEKEYFFAKKGDVFFWHANLIHGGEKMMDKELTRKSMVYHYFDIESICFHEITQRPALMKEIN